MFVRLIALFAVISAGLGAVEGSISTSATAPTVAVTESTTIAAQATNSATSAAALVTGSATAVAPTPFKRHLTTIENDYAKVVLASERGALVEMQLKGHHPIKLPKHYLEDDEEQDLEKFLPVLAPFHPNPLYSDHNYLHGFDLEEYPVGKRDWDVVAGGDGLDMVTFEATEEKNGLIYRLSYKLLSNKAGVACRFEVINTGETRREFSGGIVPVNGIHQDVGNNENYYLTVATNTGGEDGDFDTYGFPSPGSSEPVSFQGELDYIAVKSRFFAAVFVPQSIRITGTEDDPAPKKSSDGSGTLPEGWGDAGTVSNGGTGIFGGQMTISARGYKVTGKNPRQQAFLVIDINDPVGQEWVLEPGETLTLNWDLFATSMRKQDLAMLTEAEAKLEFTDGFHRFFRLLSNILTYLLNYIAMIPMVGYGLAVVLLTVLLKALLHTTTYKQQKSMMAMSKLAPEMKKLQERYAGDRQALAAKQMELWKQHGVNPFGGCLPIFIQAPIFIALYQTFSHSADMRGESFLWLADLTLPDQALHMPWLFGLTLNPLPIVYILASLWMSFSMKPPASAASGNDQQQQMMKMMRWLPVIFGFIFYNMPSGLVLYFTCSAILGALEMRWIRARLEAKGV